LWEYVLGGAGLFGLIVILGIWLLGQIEKRRSKKKLGR
jgi:xanthine/uracil permease